MVKVTKESLGEVTMIKNPALSPDGRWLAYCVFGPDLATDRYLSSIWLLELESGVERRLTTGGNEHLFFFEGAATLVYAVPGPAGTRMVALNVESGAERELFTVPAWVTDIRKLGDGRYAVRHPVDLAPPPPADACWDPDDFVVCDELPAFLDGAGHVSRKREALSLFRPGSGALVPVSGPLFNVMGWAVAGDTLVYSGLEYDGLIDLTGRLMACDLATGESRELARSEGPASAITVWNGRVWYCFVAGNRLCSVSLEGGDARPEHTFDDDLFCQAHCDAKWLGRGFAADEGGLWYILNRDGGAQLGRFDGTAHTMFTHADTIVAALATGPDGALYCAALPPFGPMELYTLEDGRLRQLTRRGAAFMEKYTLSPPQKLVVKNRAGVEIEGWVIPPPDAAPGQKTPGLLVIHGGPRMTYGGWLDHDMQTLAAGGYTVFYCNPRGSSGRGRAFAEGFVFGADDFDDIMDFTDGVLAAWPQVDGGRLAVTGMSYGGYLTNQLITRSSRFRAAISQSSVVDYISMLGTTDMPWEYMDTLGLPWENFEGQWARSPLKNVAGCKTPTLFLQPEQDHCLTPGQGMEMYTALKRLSVPARLVIFKGDSHNFHLVGKPSHRVRRHEEMFAWLAAWTGPKS